MSDLSETELINIVRQVVRRTMNEGVEAASAPGEMEPTPGVSAPAAPTNIPISSPSRKISMGADHGGYEMKENLKSFLKKLGYEVIDCGTHSKDSVDYPDYAYAAAKLVSDSESWRGIIIDGAGIGSCMAANKVAGVRAAMCYDYATAVNSREHNHANVLTLGGRVLTPELATRITQVFLSTAFDSGRHARRVAKIMDIDSSTTQAAK